MTMISVHSSGQPSTKMIACDRIMNWMGDMLSDSTHCSTSACPPRIANTPENSAEPTNSQHTMAVVLAVRNTASLVRFQSSVRGLDRQQERAGRADAGGLGRRRDAEQDDGEHDDGENAERHHRRGQKLDDLEPVGVQPPVVANCSSAQTSAMPPNHR